jgi:c-di-AMP phosphodiesterase-like protein
MQKNKSLIIIGILLMIIIVQAIFLYKSKAKEEIKKSPENVAQDIVQNVSKGIKNVYVQVRIKEQVGDGEFTDSMYFTAEEWSKKSEEDIKNAIQGRVDGWKKATTPVENPVAAPAPTQDSATPASAEKKVEVPAVTAPANVVK